MPTPDYILALRHRYGQGLLLLPGVCGVVLREDLEPGRTHLLLGRRADTGRWALPAGIVEPGEQPATALVREIAEETRVHAVAERLVWVEMFPPHTYPNGDVCQFLTSVFRCRYAGGEAAVGDEESTEVGWFDLDALPPLDAKERRAVELARADDERCAFSR